MKIKNTAKELNSKKKLTLIIGVFLLVAVIAAVVYWGVISQDSRHDDAKVVDTTQDNDKSDDGGNTGGASSDTPVAPTDKDADQPIAKKDVVPVVSSYAVAPDKKSVLVAAMVTGLVENTAKCTISLTWPTGSKEAITTAKAGPNSMSCVEVSLTLEGIPIGETVTIKATYTSDVFEGSSSNNPQITIGGN